MAKAAHHSGTHQRRAKRITDAADADPTTECWRCHRTKAEHGRPWHAGHLNDGEVDGPMAAECEQCNTSAGATHGNRMRQGLVTTRAW